MARRDKEIFLTLSAIGAAGLLVFFLNGPSSTNLTSDNDFARARRAVDDGYLDDFCFDDICSFLDDDVEMFQDDDAFCEDPANELLPVCQARAGKKKKGKGNKQSKGKSPKGKQPAESVDYSGLWKEAEAKDQMDELNDKAAQSLDRWHRNNDMVDLAALSPDVTVRDFDSFELSTNSMDVFAAAAANGANDCSLDTDNRVSSATQSVFYLFPSDMMYDSTVDQDSLMASYRGFGADLARYINDGTKFVVGSYNAVTGKPTVVETDAKSAGQAIDELQTKFNVPTRTSKGQTILKVAQLKIKSLLSNMAAPAIRNKYFRRSDDGQAQSCQAFIIFHGLPTDYKDLATGEFDIDSFNKRCNIIPIFVAQSGLEAYYNNMAANWRMTNSLFSAAERSFRGYIVTNPTELAQSSRQLANQMTSFVCACESRSACLVGKPHWIEEDSENFSLTTAATTTDGTTTSMYSTTVTSTTEWSTTDDGFRGIDTTEEIPTDKRCCGYAGDIGALKYDQNRQFCCNDGDMFSVSDEVC